jgi:bacteriorhodopsin
MVEFFIILSAVTNVPGRVFWKLILGTLVMLIGGYVGEAGLMAATPAFVIGMVGWAYIIFEIYAGEAGQLNASSATPAVQSAFKLMRNIVVVGWAIYPLGYYFGYMTGGTKVDSNTLNLIYNLADFVNKIGFGVIIWKCAVSESDKR